MVWEGLDKGCQHELGKTVIETARKASEWIFLNVGFKT